MVEIHELTGGYGGRPVLRDVSLSFPEGAVTVLLGPNGCGKSTLLKSIIGLVPQVSGRISVDGDWGLGERELARRVAYLPQSRPTPDMTAGQLVLHGRFPHLSYPRRYRPEDHAAARQAMESLGIGSLWEEPLQKLSGGMRQKCYIAMALAQNSPAILMDEPLNSLDISHQLGLMKLARELAAQGRAMVLVLHDIALALEYGDRIAVMDKGRILMVGSPEEVHRSRLLEQVFRVRVRRWDTPEGWVYAIRGEEQ